MMLPVILFLVYGTSTAIADTILFHYDNSRLKKLNPNFWNYELGSKNKYKNGNKEEGERFFLSTTILVVFTDAFHLFKAIGIISFFFATLLSDSVPVALVGFTVGKIVFELVYRYLETTK